MHSKFARILLIVVLVVVVPILVGRFTAQTLEFLVPPPESPLTESLAHTRAITRIAVFAMAGYYVVLTVTWLVLRWKRKAAATT